MKHLVSSLRTVTYLLVSLLERQGFVWKCLMTMLMMMVLKESHPDKYTEHCWNVENRGAVGETTFHVCFLMGTPTHMYCAKR